MLLTPRIKNLSVCFPCLLRTYLEIEQKGLNERMDGANEEKRKIKDGSKFLPKQVDRLWCHLLRQGVWGKVNCLCGGEGGEGGSGGE